MAKKIQSRLTEILEALPEKYANQLLEFAEFIFERHGVDRSKLVKQEIPRPDSESVVQAIKRLTQTYPMLEPSSLFNETSGLMSESVLGGKPAAEVIDKLESLFQDRYQAIQSGLKDADSETEA
jgi:hypothetical protein